MGELQPKNIAEKKIELQISSTVMIIKRSTLGLGLNLAMNMPPARMPTLFMMMPVAPVRNEEADADMLYCASMYRGLLIQ